MAELVRVYSTDYCPYCDRAKRFLKSEGIPFEDLNISGDNEMRMKLVELTGMRTVPQIFIGEKSIGGYDDMMALEKVGKFREILESEGK